MALTARQVALYTTTVSIWRKTITINPTTGKPSEPTWAETAGVKCYIQTGQSQHMPNGEAVLGESDNMFTFDDIHFEASVDIQSGDVLEVTAGNNTGDYWQVRGNAQVRNLFANKLKVLASRLLEAPDGL